MEVATIITSSKDTISLFDKFIYSYPRLNLYAKDYDTAFFRNVLNDRDKIWYHYVLNDVEDEFGYNYPEEEIEIIKKHFGQRDILMFSLSYSTENLLLQVLDAFRTYISERNEELLRDILIRHPFDGIKNLE